jgi:septal ring factor EnvC (AmiA/AmiB activator)
MQKFHTFKHLLALVAGLSLASLTVAGAGNAMMAAGDEAEDKQVEKTEKKIRIIKSGTPHVVVAKNGHVVRHGDETRLKAIEETRTALEKVEERLKKAKKKDEREALEAAKGGLEHALEALETSSNHMSFAFGHMPDGVAFRKIEMEALEGALADMHESLKDLGRMRIEIREDLADAREDIADAMSELEFEFEFDTEMREEHARGLERAKEELERAEEHQLEGLKRAEEQLRRERERLERKLEERRREMEAEAPKAPESPEEN